MQDFYQIVPFVPKRIAVAGATGFVGRSLVKALQEQYPAVEIIALTRSPHDQSNLNTQVRWRQCDLFSLVDCEKALVGVDVAYYLVHSMLPSARLDQGIFADHDLILADNFARAGAKVGLRQIVYLGGLIPNTEHISKHLLSRLEVEETFRDGSVPLTALRAGLIIGPRCSSFTIVKRLVARLPVMICPRWTRSRCQPIDISDVIANLVYVLGRSDGRNMIFDIGGPSILNYQSILRQTAKAMGLQRYFFESPLFSAGLSRLWLSIVTRAPRNLVYPLVESLRHDMTVSADLWLRIPGHVYKSFPSSVANALQNERRDSKPRAFLINQQVQASRSVRSVQRLSLPRGWRARDVALAYATWLPSFFPHIVRVINKDNFISIYFSYTPLLLLRLELSLERSTVSRQLFYIRGGVLTRRVGRGRLEFREVLGGRAILAAVHDFQPVLPWYFYRFTQAIMHVLVMKGFALHLQNQIGIDPPAT